MKTILTAIAALAAAPALAHPGVHIHPHAGDPVWLPLLAIGLATLAAVTVIRARVK